MNWTPEYAALVLLGVLFLIAIGVFGEYYLGPKPKMSIDDVFVAIRMIDEHCQYDYVKIAAMREELANWMNNPASNKDYLSKELQSIIDRAENVNCFEA